MRGASWMIDASSVAVGSVKDCFRLELVFMDHHLGGKRLGRHDRVCDILNVRRKLIAVLLACVSFINSTSTVHVWLRAQAYGARDKRATSRSQRKVVGASAPPL